MDRTIWLVRHAQSEYNKNKLFTGWHDPELTDHGKHKAHDLKEELYTVKFDYVYSSPLKRALQTANIIIDDKEIIVDERLKERSYGDWSAKNKEEVEKLGVHVGCCLLYTSPSPRDRQKSRMPSSA